MGRSENRLRIITSFTGYKGTGSEMNYLSIYYAYKGLWNNNMICTNVSPSFTNYSYPGANQGAHLTTLKEGTLMEIVNYSTNKKIIPWTTLTETEN
jgi:hypothetical protein